MPIPNATTPGDSQSLTGHHGGPTLETPDLGPSGLGGGAGANKIMFLKSRSGNVLALDDEGDTLRLQQTSGNAEIKLTGGSIEIKQKTGDINFTATQEIRFDTKMFQIHASNNISFIAKGDISLNCGGNMDFDSGNDTVFAADKNLDFNTKASHDGKAMADAAIIGNKKTSVKAKGSLTMMAMAKLEGSSAQDLGVSTKAALAMTGLAGCDFTGPTVTLLAGGPIMGMSMCIAIN
ncbi:MAG: hypothetical protein ACYS22_01425 [Planctomycetota bacterium]|jgi:hypothetical protein